MTLEKNTLNCESDLEDEINQNLNKYETYIKSIFKEKNYFEIISKGTEIISLMLKPILKEKNITDSSPTSMIKTAIQTGTIPPKTKNILFRIDRASEEISDKNTSYKDAHKFLKSFKKFISHFKNICGEYNINIDTCISLIDALPNTEPSENMEEKTEENIENINNYVKILKKYIELVSEENYTGAVTEGYHVCNLMLELFLTNNGYRTNKGFVVQEGKNIPIITFCTEDKLFPEECREFLKTIENYKNNRLKLIKSYDLALSFLKCLGYFMIWFNSFYSERYSIDKPFEIEECCLEISKLAGSDDQIIFKHKTSPTKKQKSEIENNNGLMINFPNSMNSSDLEKALAELTNNLKDHISKELSNATETIKKDTETIITTLDDIKKEIKNISLKITDYQSLISRQIKNFDDDKQKDLLIAAFADECAERIIRETDSFREEDSYNHEKTELNNLLGEDAWAKLSDESKKYLISSKLMFNNLKDIGEVLDYSGVCILITKTLELELYKRFYDHFFKYLNRKYNRSYKNYPTGLLYKNREPLNPDKFNLGTVAYIFCLKTDYTIDYYQERNNEEKLIEFCEADLFEENETSEIKGLIKEFGNEIERIRENYRNPSAHRNHITEDDAEDCLNIVLYDEMLLKKMLDSFKI